MADITNSSENEKKQVAAKPVKPKKPPFGARIAKFFREYKSELKKVVWSPFPDVLKNTKTVIASIVVVCVCVGLLDLGFSKLVQLLGTIA